MNTYFDVAPGLRVLVARDDGIPESDTDRFVAIFLGLWARIPPVERDLIEKHWRIRAKHTTHRRPFFELTRADWGDGEAYGSTVHPGDHVVLLWSACELVTDECIESLVAHEMGHVYQFAIGKAQSSFERTLLRGIITVYDSPPLYSNGLTEIHADEMAYSWGVNPNLFHAYLWQYYSSDEGEVPNEVERLILRKDPRDYEESLEVVTCNRQNSRYNFAAQARDES